MYKQRYVKAPNGEHFFLFGPRGTGKTTWLKHTYADALWIDLLNPHEERLFSMTPELLKDRVDGSDASCIVIDEVQKVPKVLDVIHSLIEEKQWNFIFKF